MSIPTNLTGQVRAPATAAVTVAAFATAALALCVPVVPFDADGYRSGTTIYPAWTWVLVLGGLVAGVATVAARRSGVRAAAAGISLVAAMQLVGTGVVAFKHWKPAFGMGGGYGEGYESLDTLRSMAILLASAALIGGVAAASQLRSVRAFTTATRVGVRLGSAVAGLALVVALPLVISVGDYGAGDLTSWGAIGLIYAGPWGAALLVTGWLERTAAVGVLVAVGASVVLAMAGPQMTDLLWPDPRLPFGLVLLPTAGLIAVRVAQRSISSTASRADDGQPLVKP